MFNFECAKFFNKILNISINLIKNVQTSIKKLNTNLKTNYSKLITNQPQFILNSKDFKEIMPFTPLFIWWLIIINYFWVNWYFNVIVLLAVTCLVVITLALPLTIANVKNFKKIELYCNSIAILTLFLVISTITNFNFFPKTYNYYISLHKALISVITHYINDNTDKLSLIIPTIDNYASIMVNFIVLPVSILHELFEVMQWSYYHAKVTLQLKLLYVKSDCMFLLSSFVFVFSEILFYLDDKFIELSFWSYINALKIHYYIIFHTSSYPKIDLNGISNQNNFETNQLLSEVFNSKNIHDVPLNLHVNRLQRPGTHFPVYRSSVLTILTVWQYWWWLSFILIIVAFNRLVLRFFFQNTLKINPKTHTSIKSNGRWGDLVASLFPVFWCSNILVNSNYILKLTEKHTESALFVVRIRGKQWYWVYKFSVNIKQHVNNSMLIIGRGNKLNVTYNVNSYLPSQSARHHKKWMNKLSATIHNTRYQVKKPITLTQNKLHTLPPFEINLNRTSLFEKLSINRVKQIHNKIYKKPRVHDSKYGIAFKRRFILNKTYQCSENKLVVVRYKTHHGFKPYNRYFYTIQQQPKKVWKGLKKNIILYQTDNNLAKVFDNKSVTLKRIKPVSTRDKRSFVKKLRLISNYNTLVLPTKTNLTVITNSFDVVHSWFVPGLGIKFDCVPGRSTHYTMRIDKPGIYYGHCAEVCGRFHHHMPIKVCALPMNQFLYYHNIQYQIK